MSTRRGYLSVGRSLVTGAVVGLTRRNPGRRDPLDLSAFTLALDARDPARTSALDDLLAQTSMADLQGLMTSGRLSSEELTLHLLG
ncbi:MAG TPA: hypothetical protein VLQ92_03790, partial [Candidatus Limnocylindrales bacterium]|nr:hypothetical protein [Candidatus Limnocylindrales bacterium]